MHLAMPAAYIHQSDAACQLVTLEKQWSPFMAQNCDFNS